MKNCFLILVMFLAVLGVDDARAQALGGNPTCDSEFWDVMGARATIEGQREIEMAERIILKPDSVLEYSCFNQDLDRLRQRVSDTLFSANVGPRFFNQPALRFDPQDEFQPTIESPDGPMPDTNHNPIEGIEFFSDGGSGTDNPHRYPGPEHFDRNVTRPSPLNERGNAVFASLDTYLQGDPTNSAVRGNFNHNSLGGIPGAPSGALCFSMRAVWDYARCNGGNFDKAWFPRFDQIAGDDPRDYPQACSGSSRGSIWSTGLQAARPAAGQPGGADAVKSYVPELFGTSCSSSKKVKTGLKVAVGGQGLKDEGVCTMAGCSYNPTSGACQ